MAARSLWKGHLRLSLVSIPIRVFAATNPSAKVRFHELHRQCGTRLQHRKWCPKDEVAVPNEDVVRGFEVAPGEYVAVDDKEIERAQPEATHVIDLVHVQPIETLNLLQVEQPYYLAPDGRAAAQSFAVVRDALDGKAGLGTLALAGHERLVAIVGHERGIAMLMLRHTDELRSMDAIDELRELPKKVKASEVALAKQVMRGFETDVDLDTFRDAFEENLRKVIAAKAAGKTIHAPAPAKPAKVVNLMDALRKSLDRVQQAPPRRAKRASRARHHAA